MALKQDISLKELKYLLSAAGLPTAGKKSKLLERYEKWQEETGKNVSDNSGIMSDEDNGAMVKTLVTSVKEPMMTVRDVVTIMPDFNPGDKTALTARQWIAQVERLRGVYKWTDQLILCAALMKFKGSAKYWLETEQFEISKWENFKEKIEEAFPSAVNEADIHSLLMARNRKHNEAIEEYFFEVRMLAKRGNFSEGAIIQYVITGLNDTEMANMLTGQKFESSMELLQRIKWIESVRQQERARKKSARPTMTTAAEVKPPVTIEGAKANEISRKKFVDCKNISCFKCKERGHYARECPMKKSVNCLRKKVTESGNGYYRPFLIKDLLFQAFVDMGSSCVTLRKSDADRQKLYYESFAQVLVGFGQGKTETVGRVKCKVEIAGITGVVEVLIVPDESQEFEVIVGRSLLDQQQFKITIVAGKLDIVENLSVVLPVEEKEKLNGENWPEKMKMHAKIELEMCNIDEEVPSDIRDELKEMINTHRDCFATSIAELGTAKGEEISIKLNAEEPVGKKMYRIPFAQRKAIEDTVQELLNCGVVRESTSNFTSPIVMVPKKDGTLRMCIDFRRLNEATVKERYPMPIVEEQLNRLSGSKYFTVLDMNSGYFQIEVAEKSRHLTAFQTSNRQLEFCRMPFGLVNAPAVFQRMMDHVIGRLHTDGVLVFLDDVIIHSKTYADGLLKLQQFLMVLEETGLTLKLKKCEFLKTEVEYLGHSVSEKGIRPGMRKVEAIALFPVPTTATHVRQFLGLSGYFRKFVPNYAEIARPLNHLTKKEVIYEWNKDCQLAFEELKRCLMKEPVLAIYNPEFEHEVHCDASAVGLGGILLQREQDGKLRAVCYYSRRTTEAEAKLHSYELEVLAVAESLNRFRIYLLGKPFTVMTGCHAVVALRSKSQTTTRVSRLLYKLLEYDIRWVHRPGTAMVHSDSLSRNPTDTPTNGTNSDELAVYASDRMKPWIKLPEDVEDLHVSGSTHNRTAE